MSDQFETAKITSVIAPVELCNPADVDAQLRKNPQVHLTCYKIKDAKRKPAQPKFSATDAFTLNDIDAEQLTASKASLLCVPSTMVDVGPIFRRVTAVTPHRSIARSGC